LDLSINNNKVFLSQSKAPMEFKIDIVIYTTQRDTHIAAVPYLDAAGPPSSPPINILLSVKIEKQHTEVPKNIATEKPSFPAGT